MKCIRKPLQVEVFKYVHNAYLEDGFELFSEVITKNNVDCNNLIQVERDGQLVCRTYRPDEDVLLSKKMIILLLRKMVLSWFVAVTKWKAAMRK